MQASQFEAKVVAIVNGLRSGSPMEDDRVELKQEWPPPDKARQLAGAANRAAGEYLTYIVGVDEDGTTYPIGGVDPATWWSQMQAQFDEATPELVHQCAIHVSENEVVMAMQFLTDRAPYVIKLSNGGRSEREVPMRDGTRTRSAFRHELLRLLYAPSQVPTLYPLEARLQVTDLSASRYEPANPTPEVSFHGRIYFESGRDSQAFMPEHQIAIELEGLDGPSFGKVYYFAPKEAGGRARGVFLWPDGIELVGPGSAEIDANWAFPELSTQALAEVDSWRVRLSFAVAGTSRTAVLLMEFGDRELSDIFGGARTYTWKLLT
jgi:hypothetical protein